ncbi:MAG: hypothetical protein EU541_00135 [Promethearchaeota archaeon]|nr:MAG: hypothetical protein EU541_00135 [Candidatus Lokiarchaeota archaeon]
MELLQQAEKDYKNWGNFLDISGFMDKITTNLSEKGFERGNSRLVYSVCPDDVNRLQDLNTIEKALTSEYNNEFHLGGLGAYPMGGVSGIIAASHHPPDRILNGDRRGGNLIFFISPHFGLIEKENYLYGKIIRPGQQKITSSCGAMMGFLDALKTAGSPNNFDITPDPHTLDPTRMVLHSELINNYSDWLNNILQMDDPNDQVIDLFKLNYDLVINKIDEMIEEFLTLEGDHFEGDIAVIGGVTVNTVSGDNFILKEIKFPKI